MAQINMPGRREERDPLDTILKGLSIAANVYGIKEAGEKSKLMAEQRAADQKTREMHMFASGIKEKDGGGFEYTSDKLKQNELENAYKSAQIDQMKRKAVPDPLAEEMKHARLAEYKRKQDEAAALKTPEGRMKAMPAMDKQRLDNARLGLSTVQGMADALQAGDNTFSVFGDNDFTQQRRMFEEALGRMQSGGAISKEEEIRFKNMAPNWTDSPKIQQRKLADLQAEMQARIGTLGFKPEDLGLAVRDIRQPRGMTIPGTETAHASDQPQGGFGDTQDAAKALLVKRQGMKGRLPK